MSTSSIPSFCNTSLVLYKLTSSTYQLYLSSNTILRFISYFRDSIGCSLYLRRNRLLSANSSSTASISRKSRSKPAQIPLPQRLRQRLLPKTARLKRQRKVPSVSRPTLKTTTTMTIMVKMLSTSLMALIPRPRRQRR